MRKILANAIRWAAPDEVRPPRTGMHMPEAPEKIVSENPMRALDTAALHAAK